MNLPRPWQWTVHFFAISIIANIAFSECFDESWYLKYFLTGGYKMRKIKITVIRKMFNEDLVREYGADNLTACPMLREGQVLYADYAKPEGLCDEAWKAIYQYVFALAHGARNETFYYEDWICKPGVAICSCNDGLRPVIFKLETTDKESKIDYESVE